MMKKSWKILLFWVLAAEGVGALAGLISRNATKMYEMMAQKPPLSPPGWLFPVVWGIVYALMGIGAGIVTLAPPSKERSRSLNLMVSQLIVNFFWPLLFFNAGAYGFSLLWLVILLALVVWMTLSFRTVSPLAAAMQIPYIFWLSFAAYLNAGVWYLNR